MTPDFCGTLSYFEDLPTSGMTLDLGLKEYSIKKLLIDW